MQQSNSSSVLITLPKSYLEDLRTLILDIGSTAQIAIGACRSENNVGDHEVFLENMARFLTVMDFNLLQVAAKLEPEVFQKK